MIDKFLDYLRYERNASPLTVRDYDASLRSFLSYIRRLDNQLSLESADSDVIRSWMEDMMDSHNSPTTVNTRLSALKSLYRFALKRGMMKTDPSHLIKGPKRERRLPQFLKEKELDKLLDEDAMWQDTYKGVRARTIILVLYQTGLRAAELIGLNDSSIDFAAGQLKVTGKGNKQRVVPFGEELSQALKEYIRLRNEAVTRTTEALFVSEKGKRMSYGQIRIDVRDSISKVTTQEKRSPHVLRHTFATAMLNNGAGIESVKKLLGHENLETTMIYTHTTFEQLKRVYKQSHPRE